MRVMSLLRGKTMYGQMSVPILKVDGVEGARVRPSHSSGMITMNEQAVGGWNMTRIIINL